MTRQIKPGRGLLNRWAKLGRLGFLQIALLSAIVFQFQLSGRAQTYDFQLNTQLDGWFQQGAGDPGAYLGTYYDPWEGVGHNFDFGTLSEAVYYNPTAGTLQQIGSLTLDSTGFSGSFEDDRKVGGNVIPGVVSVSYTLNNGNNVVSFNSGVQSVAANPTLNWSIPFSETITLMTGGQDYTETIDGTIPEANDATCISQFASNSIVISQGDQNLPMNIGGRYYVDFDASDGWTGSIYDGVGDTALPYYYSVAPTTIDAAPEPGGLMVLTLGVLGLKFLASRRER